jgi:hypothetical protein
MTTFEFVLGHWNNELIVGVEPEVANTIGSYAMTMAMRTAPSGKHRLVLGLDLSRSSNMRHDKTLRVPDYFAIRMTDGQHASLVRFCLHPVSAILDSKARQFTVDLAWDYLLPWPDLKSHCRFMDDPVGIAKEELRRRCESARARGVPVAAVLRDAPDWVRAQLSPTEWSEAVGMRLHHIAN